MGILNEVVGSKFLFMYNRTRKLIFIFFAFLLTLSFGSAVFAGVGVGIGAGKIVIQERLNPGGIYELPSVPVIDTGDEPSEYGISVTYDNHQPQLQPAKDWFRFEPSSFHLEPKQSQLVRITLTLPLKTVPGDYFAYIEAHPVKKSIAGQASVGIAAAAKLYFTIAPANIFQGIYYRFINLYTRYHPWDTIILAMIFVVILFRFIGKRFKIQIAKK